MARGLHLTIDEWFYHWFGDDEKLEQVSALFIIILDVCDKIVIQKGSRLALKFYTLIESSSKYPPKNRVQVKLLTRLFIQNSDKIFWVDSVDDLDDTIIPQLPRKDLYLVQICLQTNEKYIITSDTTLYQNLTDTRDALGIVPFMVEDFINAYPDFH